jgi:hypothetical protein
MYRPMGEAAASDITVALNVLEQVWPAALVAA